MIRIMITTMITITIGIRGGGHTQWGLSRKPVRTSVNTGDFECPSRKVSRK